MADAEIVALRAKIASRPRSDDYLQRRRDIDARGLQYGVKADIKTEPATANGVSAEWTFTAGDARDPRRRAAATRLRLVHLAVGRHGSERRKHAQPGGRRPDRAEGRHSRHGAAVFGRRRPALAAGLTDPCRACRPRAAIDPGRR